jgi:hypothetical protein
MSGIKDLLLAALGMNITSYVSRVSEVTRFLTVVPVVKLLLPLLVPPVKLVIVNRIVEDKHTDLPNVVSYSPFVVINLTSIVPSLGHVGH